MNFPYIKRERERFHFLPAREKSSADVADYKFFENLILDDPIFSLSAIFFLIFHLSHTHSYFCSMKISFVWTKRDFCLSFTFYFNFFSNHFHPFECVLKCVRVFYIIFMFFYISLASLSVLFLLARCALFTTPNCKFHDPTCVYRVSR